MKILIILVLVALLNSCTAALVSNIIGNWTVSSNFTDPSTCCIPSTLNFTEVPGNSTVALAHYSFSGDSKGNNWCQYVGITGPTLNYVDLYATTYAEDFYLSYAFYMNSTKDELSVWYYPTDFQGEYVVCNFTMINTNTPTPDPTPNEELLQKIWNYLYNLWKEVMGEIGFLTIY